VLLFLLLFARVTSAQVGDTASTMRSAVDSLSADSVRADSARADSLRLDSARINLERVNTASPDPRGSAQPGACSRERSEIVARRAAVAGTFVGANALLYRYFKRAWWSGQRADHFFFRADWDQDFRDQDKLGHFFGGYHLARGGEALLRSTCMSRGKALVWAASYAALFQLQIEIWDGLYEKYGFSYADLLANTAGTALLVAQRLRPELRVIKPTISYSRSAAMRNRRNIPGEVRPSLDYSGQTYWISADVHSMLPVEAKRYWPSLLRVSAGHSITDWIDPQTGATMRAKRKILLSIDLEAEALPGNAPLWRTIKRQIGFIHLPSPVLQLTPDLEIIPWYK
jgi:uncharacterized protein YfiM (DUF2279 family)